MAGTVCQDSGLLDLYFQDISSSEPLSAEEEAGLARRIREGDPEARNTLVAANLRFVIRVAGEYRGHGVPLEDLISAGNVGLITAAERFDETRGVKFVTYAVWWIRQAIHRSLSQDSRMVRLPDNRIRLLHNINAMSQKLGQAHEADPGTAMIAEKLGVSEELVEDTLIQSREVWHLDAPFQDNDELDPLLALADDTQEAPDAQLLEDSDREQVEMVLNTLEDREAEVLRLHFGMGDADPLTLEEIGSHFSLTKERVRQIKEKALCKLRHPRRREKLHDLMEVN